MERIFTGVVIAGLASLCVAQYVSAQGRTPFKSSVIGVAAAADAEQLERGRRISAELNVAKLQASNPDAYDGGFMEFSQQTVLPYVYGRGGLSFKDRELVVIATIITQGIPSGLEWHFKDVAWRAGITEEELQETIFTTCLYAGWPKCASANQVLHKVMKAPNDWPPELRKPKAG